MLRHICLPHWGLHKVKLTKGLMQTAGLRQITHTHTHVFALQVSGLRNRLAESRTEQERLKAVVETVVRERSAATTKV